MGEARRFISATLSAAGRFALVVKGLASAGRESSPDVFQQSSQIA